MDQSQKHLVEKNDFSTVRYFRVVETKDRSAEDVQTELNKYGHEGFELTFHIGTILILEREIET